MRRGIYWLVSAHRSSLASIYSEMTASGAHEINLFLQEELSRRGLDEAGAVEAAGWLDRAGMLRDSSSRPGLPLRNLLRADCIEGAEQRPARKYGHWFIRRMDEG
jgi:hypothetical protein